MGGFGRWLNRGALALLGALLGAYAFDAVVLHFRREPLGTVEVKPLIAIPRKDRKVEYAPADPEPRTCSTSLFPQQGYPPCWYLKRHREAIEPGTYLPPYFFNQN